MVPASPNYSLVLYYAADRPVKENSLLGQFVNGTDMFRDSRLKLISSIKEGYWMVKRAVGTKACLLGKSVTCKYLGQDNFLEYAFNLFSHNAPVLSNGYNEEMKFVKETRKIWNDTSVKVTTTCIRVPVMRAHAESVNLQFEKPLDEDTARDILKNAPGVVVIDDRASNHFPTPLEVSNKDNVAVGRIRRDVSQDGDYGLDIFVCGDQIRKGAALNAVQIAEMLL